jgi:polyhydroxyalkanoate synthesis regulator phasin
MGETISKALLCGLGLASLTTDAIRKTAEDLVKQSKISEDEGRKLVKDLKHRSTQAQKSLEKHVDAVVHKLLENLNLPAVINDRLVGAKASPKTAKKSPRRRSAAKAAKR